MYHREADAADLGCTNSISKRLCISDLYTSNRILWNVGFCKQLNFTSEKGSAVCESAIECENVQKTL